MNKKMKYNNQFVMVGKSDEEDSRPFVWKCLDEIGKRVEQLREDAARVEAEKKALLSMLQDIQDEKVRNMPEVEVEEIEAMTERLVCRCLTVEIGILTPRTAEQESALTKVNTIMHEMEHQFNLNIEKSLQRAKAYLNACLSEPVGAHIDHRFQGMIIECNIDDQKKIRKRLECLVEQYSPGEDMKG
ncbi:BAG family molecular chaperone regulator 2-like [Crassostrea virginica]